MIRRLIDWLRNGRGQVAGGDGAERSDRDDPDDHAVRTERTDHVETLRDQPVHEHGAGERAELQARPYPAGQHRTADQRNTPNEPVMRTAPDGWRCTIVASSTSDNTTRSRSEPAGRSKTIHSAVPSLLRTNQLEMPSANRRTDSSGNVIDLRMIDSCVRSSHVDASDDGSRIVPPLAMRRSCTGGRSA